MVEEFGISELVGPLAQTRPPAFILPDGWPREPSSVDRFDRAVPAPGQAVVGRGDRCRLS